MNSFKLLKRDCPVCQGARRDCRESLSTGFVFCRDTDANPGGQWRFIKNDAHGFGVWAWSEGNDNRHDRPAPVAKTPSAPAVVAWPVAARDKGFQAIAKATGLHLQHRLDLRQRPHVTDTEVDALVTAGVLFTWPGGQTVARAGVGLPGVMGNGRLMGQPSWAIAIPNVDGLLAGVQIRNPEGGYFWASTPNRGGATPHVGGELPLGVYGVPCKAVLNLAEGYLKPALSQARYGGGWIGMAGGQWANSPQQLRAVFDRYSITQAVLNADGGAIQNPNVMGAYRKLASLLESWGIPLRVRWWGQTEKAHGDVDEISPETYHKAKLLTWGEFEALAPAVVELRRPSWTKRISAPRGITLAQDGPAEDDQATLAQDSERIQEQLLEALQRQIDALRHHDKLAAAYRIAPPKVQATDGEDILQFSNQRDAYKAAMAAGARLVVNLGGTGVGKSTFMAKARPQDFEAKKLLSVVTDVLNVETISPDYERWEILPGRNYGAILGPDGKKRRATIDTLDHEKVEPGNCHRAYASQMAAAKNPANPNLVCGGCIWAKTGQCSSGTAGNEYGAKYQQRTAWESPRIVTSYGRLTGIGLGDEAESLKEAVLHLDESSSNVEISKALDVDDHALTQTTADMALEEPELFRQLSPLLTWLRDKSYQDHRGFHRLHGLTLARCLDEVRALIPTDLDHAALDRFEDGHHELEAFGLGGKKLTEDERKRLDTLTQKRDSAKANLQRITELEAKAEAAKGHLFNRGLSEAERRELAKLKRSLLSEAERRELETLKKRNDDAKGKSLSPGEAAAAAKGMRLRWVQDFIAIILGDAPGNVRFMPYGIVATIQQTAHLDAMHSAKATILTDASELRTKAALAQKYGYAEHEIFIFDIPQPQHNNTTLIQVTGLGAMGRNRGEGLEECKATLVAKLKELDPTHHHFDHKDYSHDARLFLDSIGSNNFKTCTSISAAPPRPSINGLLDEYCIIAGQVVDIGDEGFQDFYAERFAEQIRQWQGRVRANLKPGVNHTLYLLCDQELPIQPDRITPSWELCPEAARKGQRTILDLVQVAKTILATGAKLTQVALSVASKVAGLNHGAGYSQARISDLWVDIKNGISLFLRGSYKKGDISQERLEALKDKALALTDFAKCLEGVDPTTQARELFTYISDWIRPPDLPWILDLLPDEARATILGLLVAIFAPEFPEIAPQNQPTHWHPNYGMGWITNLAGDFASFLTADGTLIPALYVGQLRGA